MTSLRVAHHFFDGVGRWYHRFVAVSVNDADKPERITPVGMKLVKCLWADKDDVVQFNEMDFVAKHDGT